MTEAQRIVRSLNLQPHPEGGYFKETYRSKGSISEADLPDSMTGRRNYATAIYYLLESGDFSAFHKIRQDETWHFYKGAVLRLHVISPEGTYSLINIGSDIEAGEVPQFTVAAEHWFAVEVGEANSFSLAGCTVAPGFDFADFLMPSASEMIELFPQHAELIQRLTR